MNESKKNEDDEELPKSVLQTVSEKAGGAPKVMLPEDDSMDSPSPVVDTKSIDQTELPKGRGNYQILGEIARGGMGVVLKGRDTDLGRDVAMKVLNEELASKDAIVQRFVEEAQIGGQLQHPGIVPVYELGLMADERPYFTMKLVKGRTLSALLSARKTPGEDRQQCLAIFESICQTMAYAHSKGVIHRDLKPSNVMVGAFGEVQVVDWGLAKVRGQGGVADEQRAAELSQLTVIETVRSGSTGGSESLVGSVLGTPAYMPPEQASGAIDQLDERSDVFSLGAILCEILTGRPPYMGADSKTIVRMAAKAKLEGAHKRLKECGAEPELIELCLDCLMPAKTARPQSAEELARTVSDYLGSTAERAHRAELKATAARARFVWTAALGITIVAALVGGGWTYTTVQAGRSERLEEARTVLDDAHDQTRAMREEGRLAEALEVAQGALRTVEAVAVDDALRERAERLVLEVRSEVAEKERLIGRDARNERFLEGYADIRLRMIEVSAAETDVAFGEVFRRRGFDMEQEDLLPTLDAMSASGISKELAFALDDWAQMRRTIEGVDPWRVERLTLLATDLDPHPLRMEMRRAIVAEDAETLVGLAGAELVRQHPPETIVVLYQALGVLERADESVELVERAIEHYPSDFLLNFLAGLNHETNGRYEQALAHAFAARTLRPGTDRIETLIGKIYGNLGDYPTSVRFYEAVLERQPLDATTLSSLCVYLYLLGRADEAVARLDEYLAGQPGTPYLVGLRLQGRYMTGELSPDDLRDAVAETPDINVYFNTAWGVFYSDPERRHADLLSELTERLQVLHGQAYPKFFVEIHLQRGEYEEALARWQEVVGSATSRGSAAWDAFAAAKIHHGLGNTRESQSWFREGRALWTSVSAGNTPAWERSHLRRVYEETAKLIGE